jgi:hypothetical protein
MPTPERFGGVSLRWRVAGAVAGGVLVAVFLGCMSLNIGCRECHSTDSVGVSTDANGVVKQEGTVTLGAGCTQQVFYPICYAGIPNLEISESGCLSTHHALSHQEKNCFILENKDAHFSHTFHWTARGLRDQPAPPIGPPVIVPAPAPGPTQAPALPAPKEGLPATPVPVPGGM